MIKLLYVVVPVPDKKPFYSLYTDGLYGLKTTVLDGTQFDYIPKSLLFLYYTYPTHRRAFCIRFIESADSISLPGLTEPVKILIRVHASKVDKLKKAVSFLSEHYGNPYKFTDAFYTRLHFILQQKGKINYEGIRALYASYCGGLF